MSLYIILLHIVFNLFIYIIFKPYKYYFTYLTAFSVNTLILPQNRQNQRLDGLNTTYKQEYRHKMTRYTGKRRSLLSLTCTPNELEPIAWVVYQNWPQIRLTACPRASVVTYPEK